MEMHEILNSFGLERCLECRCAIGDDWKYRDFSNKSIVVCPQCKTEVYLS